MHNLIISSDDPILVIGAAGVDIVGRLSSDLQSGTSCPAQIRTSFGGVARNVAENLARLGQPVNLITVVGEDQTGDQILQDVTEAGVNIDGVMRTSDHPTSTYIAIVNSSGELLYGLDDMRAMSTFTPDYFRQNYSLFKQASLLLVDANLPEATLRTVMSLAKRAKLPICADPTSNELAKKLLPYISNLNLIVPNSAEAGLLCNCTFDDSDSESAIKVAKTLVAKGIDIVIITLAEFGVCYATSESSGQIPAIRTQIIDPTGAGDALTSTLLFALLNDIPLDDAIRLGVSAASLALHHQGAVVPDLSLEKLYDQLII
jgi:pseudouridine kinase